jgi:hypothetical protein
MAPMLACDNRASQIWIFLDLSLTRLKCLELFTDDRVSALYTQNLHPAVTSPQDKDARPCPWHPCMCKPTAASPSATTQLQGQIV